LRRYSWVDAINAVNQFADASFNTLDQVPSWPAFNAVLR
jgi:hypothetical protein